MKAIIGLGNPGEKYKNTRHNVGFMVIDELARMHNLKFKNSFSGEVSEHTIANEKLLLFKPLTYMNLSGNAVNALKNFYKLTPENDIIVIYDDMDLPFGKIRVRASGSSGGHNGVDSVIRNIGGKFIRLKVGIGRGREGQEHVLSNFSKSELAELKFTIVNILDALNLMVKENNIEKVMNLYN